MEAEVGGGGRTVAMGTRVLVGGSAVTAFVQKPTEPPLVAVPSVPMVTCVNCVFVHRDIGVVSLWMPSRLPGSTAGAPLGAS